MVGFDALAGRAGPDGLLPPRQRAGPAAATRSGDSDWQGIAAWPVPARGPGARGLGHRDAWAAALYWSLLRSQLVIF